MSVIGVFKKKFYVAVLVGECGGWGLFFCGGDGAAAFRFVGDPIRLTLREVVIAMWKL